MITSVIFPDNPLTLRTSPSICGQSLRRCPVLLVPYLRRGLSPPKLFARYAFMPNFTNSTYFSLAIRAAHHNAIYSSANLHSEVTTISRTKHKVFERAQALSAQVAVVPSKCFWGCQTLDVLVGQKNSTAADWTGDIKLAGILHGGEVVGNAGRAAPRRVFAVNADDGEGIGRKLV
jgi:hypothetical protein